MVSNSIKPSQSITNNGQILKIDLDNINMEELKPRKTLVQKGEIFHNTKYYKQYLFPSLSSSTAYILAIIDYFQYFNFYKYVESELKTKFGKKKDKVSCVDPKTYFTRFTKYFERLTNIKHMLKDGQKNDNSNFIKNDDENDSQGLGINSGSDIELDSM